MSTWLTEMPVARRRWPEANSCAYNLARQLVPNAAELKSPSKGSGAAAPSSASVDEYVLGWRAWLVRECQIRADASDGPAL